MQLIIKPTSKCNFNCSFCSAKFLSIQHQLEVNPLIKKQIEILRPENIIITGGEPLMVSPKFYDNLFAFLDQIDLSSTLSITSNLYDFYLNPDKWTKLFTNDRVYVTTSWHLGDTRKINNVVYSEELFRKVLSKFNNLVGYTPSFISVIDNSNYDKAFDIVRIARELGTVCRLNGVLPIGLSKDYFPRYKMLGLYIKLIDNNLGQYEVNCIERSLGKCNWNTNGLCSSTIRTIWVSDTNELVYGNCEDLTAYGERIEIDMERPKPIKELSVMKDECWSCPLCNLCNGCRFNKKFIQDINVWCKEMKNLEGDLIRVGWKL